MLVCKARTWTERDSNASGRQIIKDTLRAIKGPAHYILTRYSLDMEESNDLEWTYLA